MTKWAEKMACVWLMMRSSHCPNLVRIECNAIFFLVFNLWLTGATIEIAQHRDELISTKNHDLRIGPVRFWF